MLFFLDFCCQIYGLYIAYNVSADQLFGCSSHTVKNELFLIRLVIIWAFVVDMSFFLFLGTLIWISKPKSISSDWNSYLTLWRRRIEWLVRAPTARTEGEDVIMDISSVLAHYFKGVDWSPSDVAVGLLLLKREQKMVKAPIYGYNVGKKEVNTSVLGGIVGKQSTSTLQNTTRDITIEILPTLDLNIVEKLSAETLTEKQPMLPTLGIQSSNPIININLESESNHSAAAVDLAPSHNTQSMRAETESITNQTETSSSFTFEMPFNDPLVDLDLKRQSLGCGFNSFAFKISQENPFMSRPDLLDVIHFCHYANMAYIELDNEIKRKIDILIHFSPLNDLFRAPYLISLDHDWDAIVIAIRGTYSASDLLVDLKLDSEILDESLDESHKYQVHSGFFKTAQNIVNDIVTHNILKDIVKSDARASNYHIVVCGHSLGAVIIID